MRWLLITALLLGQQPTRGQKPRITYYRRLLVTAPEGCRYPIAEMYKDRRIKINPGLKEKRYRDQLKLWMRAADRESVLDMNNINDLISRIRCKNGRMIVGPPKPPPVIYRTWSS